MGAAEEEKLYKVAICKRHHFSVDIGFMKQIKIVQKIFRPEFPLLKGGQVLFMESCQKGDLL
ncbi:hypothetical protein CEE39_09385 [bacterium (candidate division B38) B3_B38]|nr:MAG: hypothetical protein CEE39_09385 [bacterium (candidate division B38) B3_B38]